MMNLCPLCDRPLEDGPSVNEHHLTPVSLGGKEKFPIHRVCHSKIHHTLNERELKNSYYTWEALRAHPEIAKFIKWISKKENTFNSKNKDTKARRRKRKR